MSLFIGDAADLFQDGQVAAKRVHGVFLLQKDEILVVADELLVELPEDKSAEQQPRRRHEIPAVAADIVLPRRRIEIILVVFRFIIDQMRFDVGTVTAVCLLYTSRCV